MMGMIPFVVEAEPLVVAMTSDGYLIADKHVATTEQLVSEIKAQGVKKLLFH